MSRLTSRLSPGLRTRRPTKDTGPLTKPSRPRSKIKKVKEATQKDPLVRPTLQECTHTTSNKMHGFAARSPRWASCLKSSPRPSFYPILSPEVIVSAHLVNYLHRIEQGGMKGKAFLSASSGSNGSYPSHSASPHIDFPQVWQVDTRRHYVLARGNIRS